MHPLPSRLRCIDVFRAITMWLMVFVNDLDPVENIPEWIKHAHGDEDKLGFADTIFPAFLFIVGLSIPFAINKRLQKGEPFSRIALYILTRSLALLVMGFFHVNLESYDQDARLPKAVWEILITASFFLIWLDYPAAMSRAKRYILQGAGILLLLCMAIIYRGDNGEGPVWLRTYWWGILGLIGWSYLVCAGIYLLSKGRLAVQLAALVFFFLFSLARHADLLDSLDNVKEYIWIVGSGAMPAFTMAGIVISRIYMRLAAARKFNTFGMGLLIGGIAMIGLGFAVRPFDGISKLNDTPAWFAICTGISILVFGLLVWLVDVRQQGHWFKAIMPAGTSTLTCYLLPYFLYSFYKLAEFHYPRVLNEGIGGLIRSMLVAMLVVLCTGWLEKKHLRLKI